jgi:hypothetical protein
MPSYSIGNIRIPTFGGFILEFIVSSMNTIHQVSKEDLGIIGLDPSVSKTNWLVADIFMGFL